MLSVPDVALEKYAVDASSFKVVSKIMLNKTAISMFLKNFCVFMLYTQLYTQLLGVFCLVILNWVVIYKGEKSLCWILC